MFIKADLYAQKNNPGKKEVFEYEFEFSGNVRNGADSFLMFIVSSIKRFLIEKKKYQYLKEDLKVKESFIPINQKMANVISY